jgi:hypothetical protein
MSMNLGYLLGTGLLLDRHHREHHSINNPKSELFYWLTITFSQTLATASTNPLPGAGWPSAHAQAGPPLITNDPGTPGNGRREINLAATGSSCFTD